MNSVAATAPIQCCLDSFSLSKGTGGVRIDVELRPGSSDIVLLASGLSSKRLNIFKYYRLEEVFILSRSVMKGRGGTTRKIRISEIPLIWKGSDLKSSLIGIIIGYHF